MNPSPLRILLVDDHELVRSALSAHLEEQSEFRVVGVAGSAEDTVSACGKLKPHVVIFDASMPGKSPFEAARELGALSPSPRVLFLSAFPTDRHIEAALEAGAHGFVTKADSLGSLVEAVVTVANGGHYFSSVFSDRIEEREDGGFRYRPKVPITPREHEILIQVAQGLSKREIADDLGLSIRTVESHVRNLMTKLRLNDRVDLARFAIREGLVDP